MGKKTKRYTAEFKFKVVMESFQKNAVAEVARRYGVHPNQLTTWRQQFQNRGAGVFETDSEKDVQRYRKRIGQLEQLIGKKELEINLLKNFVDFTEPPDGS